MTAIKINNFKGIAPKVSSHLLPDGWAQEALNCDLKSGNLKPIRVPEKQTSLGYIGTSVQTAYIKGSTIYSYNSFTFNFDSPIINDSYDRHYTLESNVMKVQGTGIAKRDVSLDVPTETISATASTPPTDSNGRPFNGDIYYRSYVWTYVYDTGEESPISPISDSIMIEVQAYGSLTNIGPSTGYPTNAVKKRIYCTDNYQFKFLADIDVTATTFTDDIPSQSLGETLLVQNNPPSTMDGMIKSPNGFVVGWSGGNIYFTEPFLPYAWNDDFSINIKNNVKTAVSAGGDVYLLTDGEPYILSGFHPEDITSQQLPIQQGCVGPKGAVSFGNSVVYISPDGLVQLRGGEAKLLTKQFYSREQWRNTFDSKTTLSIHDEQIYLLNEDTREYTIITLDDENIINISQGYFSEVVNGANTAYINTVEDILYFIASGDGYFYTMDNSDTTRAYETMEWTSKKYIYPQKVCFNTIQVLASNYDNGSTYDLSVDIYNDIGGATPVFTANITSDEVIRTGLRQKANYWWFRITGNVEVDSFQLSTSVGEIG